MISITDHCRSFVNQNPLISEHLRLGLLNTTEYARRIQKDIEQLTYRPIKIQTIVTSLNRIKNDITAKLPPKFFIDDVRLYYPITNLAYNIQVYKNKMIGELYNRFGGEEDSFLNVIVGTNQINILISSRLASEVKELFQGQENTLEMEDLTAVSLKFDRQYLDIPGSTFQILRLMYLENINLIEITSTLTGITIFVKKADSQKILEIFNTEFIR
jgi:hypothetical protein